MVTNRGPQYRRSARDELIGACPCGLPAPYDDCCGRFHRGDPAPTAELLMRSRFSAFAVGDGAYLRTTWDPATRPRRTAPDPATRWTRLEVLTRTGGGVLESRGTVEFRAHHDGGVMVENSRFRRVDGRWVYVGPVRSVHDAGAGPT